LERIAIIARLEEGAHKQAAELLATGPPFDLGEGGFDRHAAYLSTDEVAFVFEGHEVEWLVDSLMSDARRWLLSAAIAAWRPLLDGEPRVAREVFFWESKEPNPTTPTSPA
jgi:hypothetical protein